jgi:release factor glutamine methyltransferase
MSYHRWLKEAASHYSNPQRKLEAWKQDLKRNKPLQYLLQSQPFCGLDIAVRPPVLIPRWETEEWTDSLIQKITKYSPRHSLIRILDICSGSGCISLALAHHLHQNGLHPQIIGIDKSLSCIKLAKLNQRKLNIPLESLNYYQMDLFSIEGQCPSMNSHSFSVNGFLIPKFDLIVSNPPYIPPTQFEDLDASVKHWEDKDALIADENGMLFHRFIGEHAHFLLKDRVLDDRIPRLVLETDGPSQSEPLLHLFKNMKPFTHSLIKKDLSGCDRTLECYE